MRLSGADRVACLSPAEKVKLTHVELGAYAHLFACLEEFIAPTMTTLARGLEQDDRATADALATCAADELKHMNLFREIRARVDDALGLPLTLLPDARQIVGVVLSRHPAAVLLLTAAIEWLSQLHYLTCFVDDTALDPLTRHIFESHWREESQHARLEHAETLRAFRGLTLAEQEQAIDDFIDLIAGDRGPAAHPGPARRREPAALHLAAAAEKPSRRRSWPRCWPPSGTPSSRAASRTRTSRSCSGW